MNGLELDCPFCAQGHRKEGDTSGCDPLVPRAALYRMWVWADYPTVENQKNRTNEVCPDFLWHLLSFIRTIESLMAKYCPLNPLVEDHQRIPLNFNKGILSHSDSSFTL